MIYTYINLLDKSFYIKYPDLYCVLNNLATHLIIISSLTIIMYICLIMLFKLKKWAEYLRGYMLNTSDNSEQKPSSNESSNSNNTTGENSGGENPEPENPGPENPEPENPVPENSEPLKPFVREKGKKKVHFDLPEEEIEDDLDVDNIQARIDKRLAILHDPSANKKSKRKAGIEVNELLDLRDDLLEAKGEQVYRSDSEEYEDMDAQD